MSFQPASAGTQIAIAMIGLVGSLGVAWITAGKAFDAKLAENEAAVDRLRDTLGTVTRENVAAVVALRDSLGRVTGHFSAELVKTSSRLEELQTALAASQQQKEALDREVTALQTALATSQQQKEALDRGVTALEGRAAQAESSINRAILDAARLRETAPRPNPRDNVRPQ